MNVREWIISVAIWLGRNAMESKITKIAKNIYVCYGLLGVIKVYLELEQEILCLEYGPF
jgi:hypothetical protein